MREGMNGGGWNARFVAGFLDMPLEDAEKFLRELARQGFIEKEETGYWRNTVKGCALANASAAKPIKRSTAEKKLAEFLERVEEVRRSDEFLFKVSKVWVFGSYLSDKETIGDIDLSLRLQLKTKDFDEKKWRWNESLFPGDIPHKATVRFLKSRSRSLSFHDMDEGELKRLGFEYRLIYSDDS